MFVQGPLLSDNDDSSVDQAVSESCEVQRLVEIWWRTEPRDYQVMPLCGPVKCEESIICLQLRTYCLACCTRRRSVPASVLDTNVVMLKCRLFEGRNDPAHNGPKAHRRADFKSLSLILPMATLHPTCMSLTTSPTSILHTNPKTMSTTDVELAES